MTGGGGQTPVHDAAIAMVEAALPTPSLRANIRPRMSRHPTGADMTQRIPENVSIWLVDWSVVTIMGNTMPPRDPNDDDDDDAEEEDDAEADDHLDPAGVREHDKYSLADLA